MKEIYERPMIMVEEFSVNRAIATCDDEVGRDITFDCMIGSQTDTTNVLTDSCNRKAGTTEATTATASNSQGHSNHSGGTWSGGSTRTYTAPSDAIGLLYYCSSGGKNCFNEAYSNGSLILRHTQNHGNVFHVQIAPLYGTSTEEVNVGS